MSNRTLPEWADMQGLITGAYPKLDAAEYVPLTITSVEAARRWLRRMAGQLINALEAPKFGTDEFAAAAAASDRLNINIALSFKGLWKLRGWPRADRYKFPFPFVEGMAGSLHRSRMLGDVDHNDPDNWVWGGRKEPVDLLLMVFAANRESLSRAVDRALDRSGLTRVVEGRLEALSLIEAGRKEHFGFVDGRSQPILTGTADAERFSESIHLTELGEFVLGYPNTDQALAPTAFLDGFDFGRNGSYLVLRQLAQDVGAFRAFVNGDEELAAKMVGRRKDGTPLALGRQSDNNEFDYGGDRHGLGCPVGAHIRRAHPRGSLSPGPFDRERVNGHRLLRRGRPYGPKWEDRPDAPRGLFFLVLNADLERQFEFISQNWINGTTFSGLSGERDPLLGPHSPSSHFTVPAKPARRVCTGLQNFVTVKGGEYFFLPGIKAVKFLAGAE